MRTPDKSLAKASQSKTKGKKKKSAKSALPKVPGGKALARIHHFRVQRGLDTREEKEAKRPLAATCVTGLRQLVRSAPATARRRPDAYEAAAGESPYFTAFHEMLAGGPPTMGAAAAVVPAGWRPLGPFSIPHGQTYGSGPRSRPAVSGRVSAVAFDPQAPNHLLIGAAGGGIWESNDSGTTWSARTDDQPSLSIGAVAFDPNDPTIVYAGTGEGDARSALGVGLLRSTDGGTTWNLHATGQLQGVAFFDLLVDPTNSDHLLAASTEGLFRSTDGGATWNRRRSAMTFDLSLHVAANGSREFLAAGTDGLFRSTNGTSWSAVNLPNAPALFGRLEVAHAPSAGGVVYVWGANEMPNGANTKGYLWRRSTMSGNFVRVTTLPPGLNVGQAWYDWFAAVAPNNPNVIYVGAINIHRGIRSVSGSWSWTNISARPSNDSIHPDQHAIAFNPLDPNDVLVGNDGGVYRSSNGGGSWSSLNRGLNITEFEFICQHPDYEAWLMGGTQDNGTLRYQNQQVWYLSQDGDGGDCGVNANSPATCYHSFYGMYLERSTKGGGWGTWTNTALPANNNEGLFYPPMEVNGSTVAKAGKRVYVSRSKASPSSWSNRQIPSGQKASALAIPTPSRVYVGTTAGRIYTMSFSSGTWSSLTPLTTPRFGYVSDLLIDPTDSKRIWVTYSSMSGGHVFRSDDTGVSWTDVSAGLPNIPVNAIELDPSNPDTVFVAADVGVHRSDNAGATWQHFNHNLPNCLIKDLLFHKESRLLRAATQSRGVWEIEVDVASQPAVQIYVRDNAVDAGRVSPSPSGVANPFDVGGQVFWWESPDIKIDAPSFLTPGLGGVDFEAFEDDQSMIDDGIQFADGLKGDLPQRGQPARVYVQVHNRGIQEATDIETRVFFTSAAATLPNLPTNFWTGFPNNSVPASSPWQPIAAHKTTQSIAPGRSRVIGFDWNVPLGLSGGVTLLAVSSASNDSISTTERVIAKLVPDERYCAVRSMLTVNPPPSIGPQTHVAAIQLPTRARKSITLRAAGRNKLIRGLILPKSVVKAKRKGLKKVPLHRIEAEELQRLVDGNKVLSKKLDLTCAYTAKTASLLEGVKAKDFPDDTLLVLLARKPKVGNQAVVVEDEEGAIVGGFTFCASPEADS